MAVICCSEDVINFDVSLNNTKKNNGWMACDFTSFPTVFQSYQDDGMSIMKDCVQRNSIYG